MASGRERRLLPEFLLACLSTDAFFEHMSRHAKGSKKSEPLQGKDGDHVIDVATDVSHICDPTPNRQAHRIIPPSS